MSVRAATYIPDQGVLQVLFSVEAALCETFKLYEAPQLLVLLMTSLLLLILHFLFVIVKT